MPHNNNPKNYYNFTINRHHGYNIHSVPDNYHPHHTYEHNHYNNCHPGHNLEHYHAHRYPNYGHVHNHCNYEHPHYNKYNNGYHRHNDCHKHDYHKHDYHKHDYHKHDYHKHDCHKHDYHKHDYHKHDHCDKYDDCKKNDYHKHNEHKHDECHKKENYHKKDDCKKNDYIEKCDDNKAPYHDSKHMYKKILPYQWMIDCHDRIKEIENSNDNEFVSLKKVTELGNEFTMVHAACQQLNNMSEISRSLYFVGLLLDVSLPKGEYTISNGSASNDTNPKLLKNTTNTNLGSTNFGIQELRKLMFGLAFDRLNEKEVAAHYLQKNCIEFIQDIPNNWKSDDPTKNEWKNVLENVLCIINKSEYILHQLNKFAMTNDDTLDENILKNNPMIDLNNVTIKKVLQLNKTNVDINNKIKDDASVVRLLINYKVNLRTLKDIITDYVTTNSTKIDVDSLVEALENLQYDKIYPNGHDAEITVCMQKNSATTLLYFGKPIKTGSMSDPLNFSNKSSVLPNRPNYSLKQSMDGVKIFNTNDCFKNSIYKNPNLYTMVEIPYKFRLDTVRVFTKNRDYNLEITEGFVKKPSKTKNFIENGKTNECMKLCYCLEGKSQYLPIDLNKCNEEIQSNYAIIKIKDFNPKDGILIGSDVSFTNDCDCLEFPCK